VKTWTEVWTCLFLDEWLKKAKGGEEFFFLFFLVLFAVSGNMVSLCYQLEGGEEEGK
jgi:hypothetical protein